MSNRPKILLLGSSGQLGQVLCFTLSAIGQIIIARRPECDLYFVDQLIKLLDQVRPDIVVNAAAYTHVDLAEKEPKKAFHMNATIPEILATWSKTHGVFLVHYSTDYVFDGVNVLSYHEQDQTNPLNQYGASKAAGEMAIQSIAEHYLILRTSWVYSEYGHNFVKTILQQLQTQTIISVVDDQIGAPTSANSIAQITTQLLSYRQQKRYHFPDGLYHISGMGKTSRYYFARFIKSEVSHTKLNVINHAIKPVASDTYQSAAKRPLYVILETKKLQQTFGLVLPCWQQEVKVVLRRLLRL